MIYLNNLNRKTSHAGGSYKTGDSELPFKSEITKKCPGSYEIEFWWYKFNRNYAYVLIAVQDLHSKISIKRLVVTWKIGQNVP